MVLSQSLREEIKDLLIEKFKKKIETYDFSKTSGNPFIDIPFGKYSALKSFVHSTATMLGSVYEVIAKKIAEKNPEFVEVKKFAYEGMISSEEKAVIADIVKDLEEKKVGSDYEKEIKEVYSADDRNIKATRITIDLYLKAKSGKEYFVEIKGPDPNKKEVRAAKIDLLNVIAMKKRKIPLDQFDKKVGIVFGVYYNNTKGEYKNWKVSPIFRYKKGLLVQEDFWDFIGGNGTYNELREIISEVGQVVTPLLSKKLKEN